VTSRRRAAISDSVAARRRFAKWRAAHLARLVRPQLDPTGHDDDHPTDNDLHDGLDHTQGQQ
jgi:hypothetical protein